MDGNTLAIMVVNGDQVADLARRADLALVEVSKEEIDQGLVEPLVDRLAFYSNDPWLARKFMGRMLLAFDGYNDDSREITEIPELVAFFVKVTDAWPYWLHFLEHEMMRSVQVALNVYIESTPETMVDGQITSSYDKKRGVERIMKLFNAMRALHEEIRLPMAKRQARMHEICGITTGIFMDDMSDFN